MTLGGCDKYCYYLVLYYGNYHVAAKTVSRHYGSSEGLTKLDMGWVNGSAGDVVVVARATGVVLAEAAAPG